MNPTPAGEIHLREIDNEAPLLPAPSPLCSMLAFTTECQNVSNYGLNDTKRSQGFRLHEVEISVIGSLDQFSMICDLGAVFWTFRGPLSQLNKC